MVSPSDCSRETGSLNEIETLADFDGFPLRPRRQWCTDFDDLSTTATLGVDSTMAFRVFNERNNLSLGCPTTRLYCRKIHVETNADIAITLPSETPCQ